MVNMCASIMAWQYQLFGVCTQHQRHACCVWWGKIHLNRLLYSRWSSSVFVAFYFPSIISHMFAVVASISIIVFVRIFFHFFLVCCMFCYTFVMDAYFSVCIFSFLAKSESKHLMFKKVNCSCAIFNRVFFIQFFFQINTNLRFVAYISEYLFWLSVQIND